MGRTFFILAFYLSTRTFAAETLRLHLDWFPSSEFAGILVAIDKGWYEEAGIKVKPLFTGLNITENVLSDDADIGMHSGHEVIRTIGKGHSIKAFGANYQFNPLTIITGQESKIKELKDVKGKKLGVFTEQEYEVYRVMLEHVGLSFKDVQFIELKTFKEDDLIKMLKDKKIDAFTAWEFNWPVTFALKGYPVRQFPSHAYGFNFYGIVFFAKPKYIVEHRATLKRFLEITARGWDEVYRKPETYVKEIVERWYPKERLIENSKDLTLKQQLLEVKLSKRYLYDGIRSDKFGTMSKFKWEKSLEVARMNGILPKDSQLKAEDLFDAVITEKASR